MTSDVEGIVPKREVAIAVSLMRRALAVLDRGDEPLAAARLQHAIDVLDVPEANGTGEGAADDS